MKRRMISAGMLTLALAAGLVGCGQKGNEGATTTAVTTVAQTTTEATKVDIITGPGPVVQQKDYFEGTVFSKITPENFLRIEISLYDYTKDPKNMPIEKYTISNYSEVEPIADLIKQQEYVYNRIQGADEVEFGIHMYFTNEKGEEDHITVTEGLVLGALDDDPSIIPNSDGGLVYAVRYTTQTMEECKAKLTEICSKY